MFINICLEFTPTKKPSYKSSCKKTDKIIFINRYAEKSDQQENIQI